MRSKANFRSHPIHPMLIPFPIAFLVGALGFDIAGVVLDNPDLWRTGGWLALAGIAAALVAAVPGFIDFIYTVPPDSSAKRRATLHMTVILTAGALFAAAAFMRAGVANEPTGTTIAIEAIAIAFLSAGGWMGGVLVGRNQISVDHRYAGAGKWREERISITAGTPAKIAQASELQVDQIKLIHTGQGRIVLARSESGWLAFDDRCTHRGASLADGVMICGTVQCPWHGSQFDGTSGAVRAGPASEPIRTYKVEEKDGAVYLTI